MGLLIAPIVLIIAIGLIFDPSFRSGDGVQDPRVDRAAETIFRSWPAWIVAATSIAALRWRSGPLRVWPEALTIPRGMDLMFGLRQELIAKENIRPFVISLISAIVGAVLTVWLT